VIKCRSSGKVSLDRVNNFLNDTELLDAYAQQDGDRAQLFVPSEEESELIGFRDAVFSWSNESGALTPSKRKFRLRIDGEVYFQPGRINLVIGPTGSGKTSVLMALLGGCLLDFSMDVTNSLLRRDALYALWSNILV
jgi:ABC-type multidrug transport system fused ATPase/permease subunit